MDYEVVTNNSTWRLYLLTDWINIHTSIHLFTTFHAWLYISCLLFPSDWLRQETQITCSAVEIQILYEDVAILVKYWKAKTCSTRNIKMTKPKSQSIVIIMVTVRTLSYFISVCAWSISAIPFRVTLMTKWKSHGCCSEHLSTLRRMG